MTTKENLVVNFKADSVSPRMNTIASPDQFKPIRIGEHLVVNYNYSQRHCYEIYINAQTNL